MLRILFFAAFGLLVGGVVLLSTTGDTDFLWMLPTGLTVSIITGAFSMIGKTMRGLQVPSAGDTAAALAEGRAALARITSVERTGTSINDVPVHRIGLVVAPRDRPAYRTEVKALLDAVAMLRHQPGQIKVVGRHALDRPEVWIVAEPDTTWARAAEEGDASVPRTAPEWKADKDAPGVGRQPIIGIGAQGRTTRFAVYGLVFALALGLPIALNAEQLAIGVSGIFTDADDFHRGEGAAQRAVDELIALMGDSMVTDITFHDDFVTVEAPTTPGAVTVDDFEYRYFEAEREGPSLIQPDNIAEELFDLNDVDFSVFPTIFAAAEKATGIHDDDSPLIVVSRALSDGAIEISVSLSDEYFHGSYDTDAKGNLVGMSGGHPGSEAYIAEHAED